MEESYNQLGGKDRSYYKNIALNFEELDNLQKFSELELAKHATNPERSQFLTAPLSQGGNLSTSALNGTRILHDSLVYSMKRDSDSVELSKEVSRYIAFRKMEKSREDQMRSMIDSAVSILEESDQVSPNPQVKEVKDLLDDHGNKLNLEVIPEEDESLIKAKPSKDEKASKDAKKESKDTKKDGKDAKKDSKDTKKSSKDIKDVKKTDKTIKEPKDEKKASKDAKTSKDPPQDSKKDSKSKEPKDKKTDKSAKDVDMTKSTDITKKKSSKEVKKSPSKLKK